MFINFSIQTHTPHAAWCCRVRPLGRQSHRAERLSRHWLCACAVGSRPCLCHPCRSVPSLCSSGQSYSIYTMLSLPTEVMVLLVPHQFISMRCSERPCTECLRSLGLSGSRPRKAAICILCITGCLWLLYLSCCSTAAGSCGAACRRTCIRHGRHASDGIAWLPPCGNGRAPPCAHS